MRLRELLALLLLVGFATSALAQPTTDRDRLLELAGEYEARFFAYRGPEFEAAKAMTTGFYGEINESPNAELMGIRPDGTPIIYYLRNVDAAFATRTDSLQIGGGSGFELTGATTTGLGVWDGSAANVNHPEFGGRVTVGDGSGASSNHSSHVTGTMIAAGVDALAKGMATEATITSYSSANDRAEMATAAAAGMKISNHSYGPSGPYGSYGTEAYEYDEILHNAPYYSIVVACGNLGPSYNTMPRDAGAKNIFSIGNMQDLPSTGYTGPGSVTINSSSSIGPVADGRIKPDMVANGTGVYSTAINGYTSMTGTSMAAPNFAGSMYLLVELYEAGHNEETPLSSTLKAITINTADECGPAPGPDYKYGYGLMNATAAARLIDFDAVAGFPIQEITLLEGETWDRPFASEGNDPVKVTIAWTDPPPHPGYDDFGPVLVNDLDLRLTHSTTGQVFKPWVLDESDQTAPADTADNAKGNVEQVYIDAPLAGTYTLTISHKDSLTGGQQTFGLAMNGLIAADDSRVPPDSLSLDLNYADGGVLLDWTLPDTALADTSFIDFRIYRNGQLVDSTTNMSYQDSLPDFGQFRYMLSSMWENGESYNNPMDTVFWATPLAPSFVDYEVIDGVAGDIELSWMQVEPGNELAFDDGTDEMVFYVSDLLEPGVVYAHRMTAQASGPIMELSFFAADYAPADFGPIELFIAAYDSANPDQPGQEIGRSVPYTPFVPGWHDLPFEFAKFVVDSGEVFWACAEWVETGVTVVGIDRSDEAYPDAFVNFHDGWNPATEYLNGTFRGVPMIRATYGTNIPIGVDGLNGWTVYRDDLPVGENLTEQNLMTTLPGLDIYEFMVMANYTQGDLASPSMTVDGATLSAPATRALPQAFELRALYPNPFNPTLTAEVYLPRSAELEVVVYNVTGQRVAELASGRQHAGNHRLIFDGTGLASGVYFVRAQVPGELDAMRKVVLLK